MHCCHWKGSIRQPEKHQILISEFGEARFRNPDRQQERKIFQRTTARSKYVQSGLTSKKSLQGTDHTNLTRSVSRGKDIYKYVHKTRFSINYVFTQRSIPRQGWRYFPKKGCAPSTGGASLHMMWFSSLNHRENTTVRQAITALYIQTAKGIVVSDVQANVYIKESWRSSMDTFGERFSVSGYRSEHQFNPNDSEREVINTSVWERWRWKHLFGRCATCGGIWPGDLMITNLKITS